MTVGREEVSILSIKKNPYVTSFFCSWNNNSSVIKYFNKQFKSENKPGNLLFKDKTLDADY